MDDSDTTYTAVDLMLSDDSVYELVDGTSGIELKLQDGQSLDFEAASQPSVTVSVGGVDSALFSPEPTDVDEAPTAVTLTAVAVAENADGAVVATVTVDDPDTTYLAADLALSDGSVFELVDGTSGIELKLQAGQSLDFDAETQPSVTVSAGGVESAAFSPAPTDAPDTGPFETLYFQVESGSDATILDTDSGTLARSQTANQEKAGINDPDPTPGDDTNPGLPDYDPYGIRPDYSGTGYVDFGGGAENKVQIAFDAPAGDYDVTVRVAANNSRSIAVAVDGGAATAPQDANTGEFYLWKELTISVSVDNPGTHQLVIAQTSGAGPNIDAVAISAPGAEVNFAAPEITSEVAFDVAENSTEVGTVEAKDIDGDDLTYTVTGGADQVKFSIDAATGVLSFVEAPDYETPGSDAGSNVYDVVVSVSDGTETVDQTIAVTVTDESDTVAFVPFDVQPSDDSITLAATNDGDNTFTVHSDLDDDNDLESSGTFHPGSSGAGYVDFGDDPGDTATFVFSVPTAGPYDLNIRYASQDLGSGARVLDLSNNDGTAVTTSFPSTDPDGTGPQEGFDHYEFLTQTVTLVAGENTVALAIAPGTSAGPNVDRIEITEAGTGPIGSPDDVSADEDGNYAAAPVDDIVPESELAQVEYRLNGVDADIALFEVSLDGGTTFSAVTPTQDGADWLVTVDLSSFANETDAAVQFRVTDEVGNQAISEATITITDDGTQPFSQEIQLESRAGDVTIDDTTPGTNDNQFTQPRDPQNPESSDPDQGPDGLWDNFTGDGYLDMGGNAGDAAAFVIDAPEAGTYTFSFRYANGSDADRPMAVSVGGQAAGTIDFAPTPDWDQWVEAPIEVTLAAGENTIRIANTINTGPNLDRVVVTNNVDPVDPGTEPGPRDVIQINFQDGATPKVAGYLVDKFDGFADRGNGFSYGWVTEASATDADGSTADPINGSAYPAIAINERTGSPFDGYDDRLTGYAHFDLGSYPGRTAWEMALEDGWYEVTVSVGDTGGPNDSDNKLFVEGDLATAWAPTDIFKSQLVTTTAKVDDGFLTLSAQGGTITEMQYI